jgi:hypothetical protein
VRIGKLGALACFASSCSGAALAAEPPPPHRWGAADLDTMVVGSDGAGATLYRFAVPPCLGLIFWCAMLGRAGAPFGVSSGGGSMGEPNPELMLQPLWSFLLEHFEPTLSHFLFPSVVGLGSFVRGIVPQLPAFPNAKHPSAHSHEFRGDV